MKKSEYLYRNLGIKTIVGMEKRLLLFISILLASIGFAFAQASFPLTDIDPVYSGTIHGNCFLIGNTNTYFPGITNTDTIMQNQDMERNDSVFPIMNTPKTTDGIVISNCNFAEFCLNLETECGDISIEDARLSWGGRANKPIPDNVYVKITDGDGYDLPLTNASLRQFTQVSGTAIEKAAYIGNELQADGFYIIHKNITEYIKNVISDSNFPSTGNYRIYVANVPVKLKKSEKEGAGQFCGWNFSLVYKHPMLPRRSIMVYNTDLFQSASTEGHNSDPICTKFNFGSANPFTINDTISFAYCGFGGMLTQGEESFIINKNGDLLQNSDRYKKTSYQYDQAKKITLPYDSLGTTPKEKNTFGCTINYLYKNKDCEIKQFQTYSRGFDLMKTTLDPGKNLNEYLYINKGDSSFKFNIIPEKENHFLTNVLLYIGAPDAPMVALPMEMEETDIEPDKDFTCKLYVKTGYNKNGLTNINVRIPISEYVDSIVSCDISFDNRITSKANQGITNSNNVYPTVSVVYGDDVKDLESSKANAHTVCLWDSTYNKAYMKGSSGKTSAITFMNDYLHDVDKTNNNYSTNLPSVLKTREIVFSFKNGNQQLVVPNIISDTNAIVIVLKLHSKKADDPVYNKQTYMAEIPRVIPQAQLDLTDDVTKDTSIFESTNNKNINWDDYRCELNGNGDGDGNLDDKSKDQCKGLNGEYKTGTGIYKKNNEKLVEINIHASSDCRETPDSIVIHFCDELHISALAIKDQLAKMEFDIDSIARVDSCIWERHKRDELVDFAGEHGVNRALLEELLSNQDQSIQLIDTTQAWKDFFAGGCQPALEGEDVDSIVNMEMEFSDIYVLFKNATDTLDGNIFQKDHFISLRDTSKLSEEYEITQDEDLFLYYKSPWKRGDGYGNEISSCSDFIPVKFVKEKIKDPIVIYDGDTIKKNDTIYACLGNELQNIKIRKDFPEYDLYATITDTIGGTTNTIFNERINQTFDTTATWNIQKTGSIDTDIPGNRTVKIRQKDLAGSCMSENFTFFVKVLDLKIDETPDLDNIETEFCRSTNHEDSITLRATKDAKHQEYKVLWYRLDKDVDEILRIKIGEGDTVNIPMDTAFTDSYITLRYEATYFKDHCESNPKPIDIKFNNFADTIKTDTMVICQYYRLTQDDVFNQLKELNNKSYSTSNVKFYPYYDVASGDVEENMRQALKKDSMSFEHLMDELDTQSGCTTDGIRYTHFVIQGVTDKGCGGAPSLVTVKINCRTKDVPVFAGGVDSIRYCTGDSPITNFDEFLDEPDTYSEGYKWVWKSIADASTLPVDKYRSTAYANVTTGGNPMTNTAIAGEEKYVVVRIDSNSCVSDVDTFRIVVADAITSYAMIGDTTQVINVTEKEFSLNFCEGANPYNSKTLPAIGYPSRDYILEWYKKDNQNDDCDTLEKYNKNRLAHTIDIDYSNTDTIFYAMRQSTIQGCKGPWLNVGIYIHPNVDSIPRIDTVVMCEGEFPKEFNIHRTTDKDLMLYLYASDKKTEVLESEMKVDTTADRYLFSAGKSLYYAQYKDKNTQCYGPMVGANAIVNPKPHLPKMNEDTTVYLCAVNDTVNLTAKIEATINNADFNTRIQWTPKDHVITKEESNAQYYVFQKDTVTECLSDSILINVKVENTIKYNPFGTKNLCYGESISLQDTIGKLLHSKNDIILQKDQRVNIYKLVNKVKGSKVTQSIQSQKTKGQNDTTQYLIEIEDIISGCRITDTATVIFNGLPNASVDNKLSACQNVVFTLPTPNDKTYNYTWKRASGDKVNGNPAELVLDADETVRLVEVNPLTGCVDSFDVDITIYPTPANAITQDTAFCQDTKSKKIDVSIQTTPDGSNDDKSVFNLQWFNEQMDSVSNPIITDNFTLNEIATAFKYTVRQRNTITQCYKDTTIEVIIRKTPDLGKLTIDPVCEPATISLYQEVIDHVSKNIVKNNFENMSGLRFSFGQVINAQESALTEAQAQEIHYTAGRDSVRYTYTVEDDVCSASAFVDITINKKPNTPVIEKGKDTVWFCSANGQLQLTAKQNNDTQSNKIFWGDYTSTQQGDTLLIPSTPPVAQYTAFAKNIQSGCVSGFDTIIAEIKEAIKVSPIAENGVLEKCEGEVVNVYDLAIKSFNIDSTPHSTIHFNATENGFSIGENELKSISKTQQDTLHYIFTIEDETTLCDATNQLTLIFHKNPVFDIEGKTILCEGDTVELSAVGDERPVTYAWGFEGGSVMSTSTTFSFKDIRQDTIIYLIENLKGTTCSDTLTQHLTVNVAPTPLPDTAFPLCQDTTAKENAIVNIGRSNNDIQAYSIKWYDQNSEMISEKEFVEIGTKQTATYSYQIETINKKTSCVSQRSHVVITVNPQITIGLDKIDTICQPFTYSLKTNAISTISGGTNPVYERTEFNASIVADDDSISESGLYTLFFTDDNQCEASKTLSIQFYEQPGTPLLIGDTILCQGTGSAKFTAKKIGANSMNQTFEWKSQTEEVLSDTLNVSTQNYGITPYTLKAVDQKSNCRSEAVPFTVDVRESIHYSPIGLLEGCYGTTIDLTDETKKSYTGSEEEKHISYFFLSENQNLTSVKTPEAISKSGLYVTKATEEISQCERQDTIEVVIYDSIGVSTEGSKMICQGDEVEGLKAINAERYTWVRSNGDNEETASFPFASTVTESENFRLIGEKKIGTLYCQDSIDVYITVNANPATLTDTFLYFCQDTVGDGKELIVAKRAAEDEKLALVWTNETGDTLFTDGETATTSIKTDGTITYHISQLNTETGCTSKQSNVTVTTLPQIRVDLKDTTTCVPNNVNLVLWASKAAHAEGYDEKITVSTYELMNNGRATDVTTFADSITSGGTYRITFQYESDGITCQSEGVSTLTFNRQPSKPSVPDQNFCQYTGEHELKGNVNANNVRLLWEDLSVYPPKADTVTTTITTDVATHKLYLVRQVQDLSGCVSEADSAWMTVYPAIESLDKDTAICYGEFVNLNEFAEGSYRGGTTEHSVFFKNADGQAFDADKVMKSNTYFAYFADSLNVCHDTATFIINVDSPIQLVINGGGTACTDQTVTLEATGAEQYEWSNGSKNPSIEVTSNEATEKTFTVEGRRMFHDIYCQADTTASVTFHNAVTPRTLTFDTCARNTVTIDDIIRKNDIKETVDTIWNLTEGIRYTNISQDLGQSGKYEIAVHNEEGCAAHHMLDIKMHSVEELKIERQEETYCYGNLANFSVSGKNAKEYEWTNFNDGTVKTGSTYNEPVYEKSEFMLIATEEELGCKDTINFTVDAYPFKDITVSGSKTSCRDSLVILSMEDVLTDVRWHMGDTTFMTRDIRFFADVDRRIEVTGIDENGCPASKTINLSVAYLEDPIIEFSTIDNTEYSLSDDVNEVEFKEGTTPDGSDMYKYTWSFGDGHGWIESTRNDVSHVYNDTLIHSRRDINVGLTVEHQYGCKKSTSAILKIDPFIFVPNTMIADGEYIFMKNYELQIYDRVGTLIYQGLGWDGTYKGAPASEDTYFYSLTYFDKGEKKIMTGYITLVR